MLRLTSYLWILFILKGMTMEQTHFRKLTLEEAKVIEHKGTELPYTGEYENFFDNGIYSCKKCGNALYLSKDKFDSGCGWPSFDDEIQGAIKKIADADGQRTEIVCAKCNGHLGHLFLNEGITKKNTRHCVNSISLKFIPEKHEPEEAIFAGGCFWGVEYLMEKQKGVILVESGYIGDNIPNPNYEMVCYQNTNYAEAVKITFNSSLTNYQTLVKYFLEIHDPTQFNKQGPDIGKQYRSEIFYTNELQKTIATKLVTQLKTKGYKVVTKITAASTFYRAEEYHQNYYKKKGNIPYCHFHTKRF